MEEGALLSGSLQEHQQYGEEGSHPVSGRPTWICMLVLYQHVGSWR